MEFRYGNLNADELQGDSSSELLVNLEADLEIADGERVIYAERAFPVVELARELVSWIQSPSYEERNAFEFVSLTFQETGVVRILHTSGGWSVTSAFSPEVLSDPMGWEEVEQIVRRFAGDLRRDLERLGVGAWLIPPSLGPG
ncbi:DUF7878 domain-containing protein [Asanoa siamensis]|uniref:DUF7878 domain-containing protein n=1 Tax=Asanoa siamensis TaxID=926357 RepID=A0ABQ4CQ09_9ACTN|nr:hypothetical protein [Asanoa siamensis]GIF73370.1 hypothetical protein Asi02nite_28880 [Asanoa siamensis]